MAITNYDATEFSTILALCLVMDTRIVDQSSKPYNDLLLGSKVEKVMLKCDY